MTRAPMVFTLFCLCDGLGVGLRVKGEGIKLQDELSRMTRSTIVCTLLCLCKRLKVKGCGLRVKGFFKNSKGDEGYDDQHLTLHVFKVCLGCRE